MGLEMSPLRKYCDGIKCFLICQYFFNFLVIFIFIIREELYIMLRNLLFFE